jgi:recombinational DNA repair ATPase RecF
MNQDDLLYRIFELLVEHSPDDDVCDLAWGAVNGDDELDAAMDGRASDRPKRTGRAPAPAGAFLTSLAVEGFRGIGSKAMINFKPGPGLVVVTGRNGSGKSSLAEGFEYALTSTTYRWKLSTRFVEQWRNLHHPEPCCITVGLAQEAVGSSTIEASWPAGSSSTSDARVTYQPYGQARRDGIAELGWATALETYRPILSYEELGRLLNEKNAQLHDSLRLMLGLDALTAAERRLKTRLDPIKQPLAVADRERKSLRAQAQSCSDGRAVQAATMLRHTRPDVSKLQALVTGATDTTPFVRALRDIAGIELPPAQQVEQVGTRLAHALVAEREIRDHTSALADRRRTLLEEALHYADAAAADVPCPVCEQGVLDAGWRARTSELLKGSDLLDQQRRAIRTELDQARRIARGLLATPPATVAQRVVPLESQAPAARAWMTWASPPAHDQALVEHLRTAFEPLANTVAGWQHEAASIEAQQEAAWQPLAVAIGAWLERYQQALADDQLRGRLESARKTLLDVEKILRKERMAPIMEHARRIWSLLRQESSVDLGDIDLTGQSVRRGVEISASVDGAEAGALSVMSQGELHALALAIFLPRAALAESPFRFIILDDPVQAMDPAKVDGLAHVLADLALTRQVIVLSHDDRLAQAARRLPTPPRILEVTRDPGSQVRVQESHSPTRRYLADADALRKDPDLPEATCREIIPGVLRQALEAACYEKYYSDRLQAGATLGEVEAAWSAAVTTKQRVQLLLGPRALDGWRMRAAERGRALEICGSGQHRPLGGDIAEAVSDVRRAIRDLQNEAA